MAFDREKYRAASLGTVTQTVQETKKFDTYFGGSSDFASFWKNRDGVTVKRVLPAHKAGDSPYVPMLSTMLKCEVEDKNDDGKVIGKKIANKKIFLGTLHGNYSYDIVEEYIKRVYELAQEYQNKDDKAKFLNPISGYRMGGKNGTWVPGIRPQLEYCYYALIEGKVYRDSLKPKQMEALNKESADLCAQNNTAAIDMFSDPNTGFPIQWSRSKDEKNKTVEVIKSLPLKMGQTWDDYFEQNAVPDEVLKDLEKYPSLQDLYVNCYRKRDFELALEGLKRFDEANIYNIFSQEDFLDMVERMADMVERNEEGRVEVKDDKKSNIKPNPKQTPAPVKKTFMKKPTLTPEDKLRVVNEEFIRQYGEGYEELVLEGEELDETYLLAKKGEDLGYDIPHVEGWDEPEEPTDEPEEEQESTDESEEDANTSVAGVTVSSEDKVSSAQSAVERIKALRAKQAAMSKKK